MNLFFEYEKENMEIIKLKDNTSFDFNIDESATKNFDYTELFSVNNDEKKSLPFQINLNFSVYNDDNKSSTKIFNVTSIKKGRKRIKELNKEFKHHDKFFSDNIIRKIQCHYLNFIVSFMNELLGILNYKEKFLNLDYKFKSNVNKKTINNLKNSTIKDILCTKISCKYKMSEENHNMKIINLIKNNDVINSILSENYLSFFKNIYYKSCRTINLSIYGLNQIITLSKNIKMYQDLINKNLINDENYKKRLNECVIRNFISKSIFLCQ